MQIYPVYFICLIKNFNLQFIITNKIKYCNNHHFLFPYDTRFGSDDAALEKILIEKNVSNSYM